MKDKIYRSVNNPIKPFEFNEEVTDVFPDMILRSVPGYPLTISMISVMADKFYQSGSNIYDLGCSLGTASIAINKVLKDKKCKIIAIDNSEAMIKSCCKNNIKENDKNKIDFILDDILNTNICNASVVVMSFSLQFIPLVSRQKLIEKIYTGKCRGLCWLDDKIFVVDMMRGVVIFDRLFQEIGLIDLQKKAEPHGLSINSDSDVLYVGQPGRDSIGVYSIIDNRLVEEINLSGKWKENNKDNHHINDLCASGDSLFVSVFSFSGNWGREVYDGGIIEIDLRTSEIVGPIISDLWMPHSVRNVSGRLCYLDSMRGDLYDTTWSPLAKFNGFVRGLDYDGEYFFVGISEHRFPEKVIGTLINIGLDAGVYMVDPLTKMTRFCAMPCTESIHAVHVIPKSS